MSNLRKKWSEFMDPPSSKIRDMIKTKPAWLTKELIDKHQSRSRSIQSFKPE
jgi:serine/threonine protein kinase